MSEFSFDAFLFLNYSIQIIGFGQLYYYTIINIVFLTLHNPFSLLFYCSTLLTHFVPLHPLLLTHLSALLFLSSPQVKSPTLAGLTDDSGRTLTSFDFSLRHLTPDQRLEGLLAFSSHEELDRFNQEARQGNRHPELFALCPLTDEVRYGEG